ncbi:MAG: hypothetical protein HOI34_10340 [Rhodospirillaceae bacterium]|jgi:hypothetical protein|nr:hypothetical protein [Rhodospirillaceae bacterium]MBT6513044.1 hypothetical protein [Rhodospirillaceae bacterium]MBT7646866.1 hypothetical protein [Rhodospirillaceae bacterium]
MTADTKHPAPEGESPENPESGEGETIVVDLGSQEDGERPVEDVAEPGLEPEPAQFHDSPRRGTSLLLVAVIVLIAAGIGAFAGPFLLPAQSNPAITALEQQVSALKTSVTALQGEPDGAAALEPRVAALEAGTEDVTQAAATINTMGQRLSDTETALASLAGEVGSSTATGSAQAPVGDDAAAGLQAQIEDLRTTIATLQASSQGDANGSVTSNAASTTTSTTMAPDTSALDARVAAVDAELDAQSTRLDDFSAQLAALEGRASDPFSAFLLAAGQLQSSVTAGQAYGDHLEATRSLAPADPDVTQALDTLGGDAESGVATRDKLAATMPDAFATAVEAEQVAQADGWVDQTLAKLEGLVTVRRTDGQVEGDGADAVTSRAEALFEGGDLKAAMAELDSLSQPAAEALADWRARAESYLAAHDALDDLRSRAVALVGGAGN